MSRILGRLPSGARLARVQASPQYSGGKFANQHHTPDLAEGTTMWDLLNGYRNKPRGGKPAAPLPTVKPDFAGLSGADPALIWFGHSSYFLQAGGLKILVDPVFSGHASPVPGMVKAFAGTAIVQPADFPELDYVLITHDHYDHLDYRTVQQLKSRVPHWITSLGVGAHLEAWGVPPGQITELDWWESAALRHGATITAAPARHFSGRGLKRARSLWSSFILETPGFKAYLGGDSGWDTHFEEIGRRFGPFDLAILECGQYNPFWKYIHMMPEEVAEAAEKLGAAVLLPVHWGKFTLALHPWKEPIERLLKAAAGKPFRVITPRIGESVRMSSGSAYDARWWNDL